MQSGEGVPRQRAFEKRFQRVGGQDGRGEVRVLEVLEEVLEEEEVVGRGGEDSSSRCEDLDLGG